MCLPAGASSCQMVLPGHFSRSVDGSVGWAALSRGSRNLSGGAGPQLLAGNNVGNGA